MFFYGKFLFLLIFKCKYAKTDKGVKTVENKKKITDEEFRINHIVTIMQGSIKRKEVSQHYIHPNYDTFLYILEGTSVYEFEDEAFTLEPGDIFFIPKNSSYSRTLPDGFADFIYLDFFFDVPENTALSTMMLSGFKDLDDLFFKLYRTWSARGPGYYSSSLSIIYKIYSKIHSHSNSAYLSKKNRILLDAIQKTFSEKCTDPSFSLKEFIKKSEISETHFRRIFKTAYNMSPNQYLIFLRINRAKELLETGNQSMDKIAEGAGFSSASYFSRIFKERTGFSPYQFQRRFKR